MEFHIFSCVAGFGRKLKQFEGQTGAVWGSNWGSLGVKLDQLRGQTGSVEGSNCYSLAVLLGKI